MSATGNVRSIIEMIDQRASTRSFRNKEIPEASITEMFTAAVRAPSSGNMQPWEFIVVKEVELKEALVMCTYLGYYSKGSNHQYWIKDAGVVFVVCANLKRTPVRYGESGKE